MARHKRPPLPEDFYVRHVQESDTIFLALNRRGTHLYYANPAAAKAFKESRKQGLHFIPEKERAEIANGETPKGRTVEYADHIYELRFFRHSGRFAVEAHEVTKLGNEVKKLRLDAQHHPLTQLPTRNYFVETLLSAAARVERAGQEEKIAVYFMDLDKFKSINTRLGHEGADTVLIEAAARLKRATRRGDLTAHRSGDEFLALSNGVRNESDALAYARRVVRAFKKPFVVGSRRLSVGISIGIAIGPKKNQSPMMLLKEANSAMFRSKRFNRPELFSEDQ